MTRQAVVLGPCPCHGCGHLLYFSGFEWLNWRGAGGNDRHLCLRARARAKGYNTRVGVSDDSATMRIDAASGAYSTGGRVVASPPGVRR